MYLSLEQREKDTHTREQDALWICNRMDMCIISTKRKIDSANKSDRLIQDQ